MKKEMTEVTINDTNQLYIPQIKVPQCKSIIMDLHLVITTKMFAARVNCNSVANCSLELFIIDPHKHAYAAKCLLDRYTYQYGLTNSQVPCIDNGYTTNGELGWDGLNHGLYDCNM